MAQGRHGVGGKIIIRRLLSLVSSPTDNGPPHTSSARDVLRAAYGVNGVPVSLSVGDDLLRCLALFNPAQSQILGVCLGACLGASSVFAPSTARTQDQATADTIVAVVDEKPVTLGELIVLRQTLPPAFQDLPDEVLLKSLVKMAVDQQILANAAQASGLQQSQQAKFALKNKEREVLADLYVQEAVRTGITEDLIATVYQETYSEADPVLQIRAAHILVDDQALANDLRTRLDEGVDFAGLAAEFGTDLTSTRGGDLGWQDVEDLLPAFATAVMQMEPGQIDGPVKSPFGWHLIRLDASRDKPVPPLTDVRDQIVAGIRKSLRTAAITSAEETASIKILSDSVPADAIRDDSLIGN